jgi:hypothetical protein
MHATTIRMSERLHRMVVEAANDEGVAVSQFVRECILVRLTYIRAAEDPRLIETIETTLREIFEESQ